MENNLQLDQKTAENYWIDLLQDAGIPDLWFEPFKQDGYVTHTYDFPETIYSRIADRCQHKEINLFKVLLAGFFIVMSKYGRGRQYITATPLTKLTERTGTGDGPVYFRFLNADGLSVRQLLDDLHAQLINAHQYANFNRDILQKSIAADHLLFSTDSFSHELRDDPAFGLHLRIVTLGVKPSVVITCDQRHYSGVFSKGFARHYFHVLAQMIAGGGLLIENIGLLEQAEKEEMMRLSSGAEIKWDRPVLLHRLFEERVMLSPDATALVAGSGSLTYRQVNEAVNRRARWLSVNYSPSKDEGIVLLMSSSPDYILWMLAVLKAGAAFIPVDPGYPEARIKHCIEDSQAVLVISRSDNAKLTDPALLDCPVVYVDEQIYDTMSSENLPLTTRETDLAYIIYTSGSTGKPKGVMLEHNSVLNTIYDCVRTYGYTEKDRLLQFTAITFDVSVCDIFCAFAAGAALVLVEGEVRHDIRGLGKLMEDEGVTAISVTPNMLHFIDSGRRQLRLVNSGGEAPDPGIVNVVSRNTLYFNSYGPTEAAIFASIFRLDPSAEDLRYIPIGRPLSNTQIWIVDEEGRPLPYGFTGELAIGGVGLARGYVNNTALTDQKFIDHPFAAGKKIYLSGDYGKYMPDGNLLFLGRKDRQIKISGYRIEIGEIEHAIRSSVPVSQLHTIVKKDKHGLSHLVVYFIGDIPLQRDDFDGPLRQILPEYMVPSFYVPLKHFPLNVNGKIDVASLPDPFTDGWKSSFVAPRTPLEERLVDIWRQLLSVEHIGTTDHFFRMGGNSILASQLLLKVHKEYSCKIDFRAFFGTPTIDFLAAEIGNNLTAVPYERIRPVGEKPFYRLSYAQQRLWVLCQFENDSIAYNMPMSFIFHGSLDQDLLLSAIRIVVQRHESLRTVFELVDGEPRQRILPFIKTPMERWDLTGFSKEEKTKKANEFFKKEAHLPFDLEKGPLLRFVFLLLEQDRSLVIFNIHHIINDGWSFNIIFKEVTLTYNSLLRGVPPVLPVLTLQYKDYSEWNRSCVENGQYAGSEAYWLDKFRDKPNGINLPLDFPRQVVQTFNGGRIPFFLGIAVTRGLTDICRENNCTLFMGLLALVKIALYRFSGQEDIILGAPVAGREHPELHDMIGFLVNTLAFRTRVQPEDSFIDVLVKVRNDALDSYEHQNYPFDLLIEKLNLTRDLSQSPLFNVMLAHNNTEKKDGASIREVRSDHADMDDEFSIAKFDLLFFLNEGEQVVHGELEYNSDLFRRSTAERLVLNFNHLAAAIVRNPHAPAGDLDFVTPAEVRVLDQFSFPAEEPIRFHSIQEYVEASARTYPERIAVSSGYRSLTYEQLNEGSNQVAEYLRILGVKRGDVVGICIDRSPELVLAILAVLKAGAAYLGMDPAYPVHRVTYMLADSGAGLVICDDVYSELLGSYDGRCLNIHHDILPVAGQYSREDPKEINGPEDIAYVIYTSGSTGTPNGAMLSHGILSNLINWQLRHSGIDNQAKSLQFTSINFCVSFQEIFITLAAGGEIHLIGELERKDIRYLGKFIGEAGIENLYLPFSFLNFLLQEDQSWDDALLKIRHIITAGEQLKISRGMRAFLMRHPSVKLHNHYGSSEMHVVTSYTLDAHTADVYVIPPAGRPIHNTRIVILDERGNISPIGVFGEIHVQSRYPVAGYINNASLNQKKFVVVKGYSDVFYRTGDVGRWLEDGNIELQGRKDTQLKIRGFRVELGEIESRILSFHQVREAVVVVSKDKKDQPFLAAYVVMEMPAAGELKWFLQQYLPHYMVPVIVLLTELPLMPNGKVDRQRLPAVDIESTATDLQAPETELQAAVSEIWMEVLGRETIGIHENFFEIGGHSIKATQVISRIYRTLGRKLDLREIFLNPTIESLAGVIEKLTEAPAERLRAATGKKIIPFVEPAPEMPHYPLSHGQYRLWVLDQINPGNGVYNIPAAYVIHGKWSKEAVSRSFQALVQRHEILRTVFRMVEGEVRQLILEPDPQQELIEFFDWTGLENAWKRVRQLIDEETNAPFDLSKGPLFRVKMANLGNDRCVLLYTLHHIISDGWSMKVLFSELLAYYRHYNDGSPLVMQDLLFQYKDYAYRQLQYFKKEGKESEQFWMKMFRDGVPLLELPTDFRRPSLKTYQGGSVDLTLSGPTGEGLRKLAQREGCSLFTVCLTLVKTLLYKYTGQEDVVIGTPVSGRGHLELESQIGFYVNTVCIRSQIMPAASFSTCLRRIRDHVFEVFKHDEYPFDKLVDSLELARDMSRSPLFDIMITYTKLEEKGSLSKENIRSLEGNYRMSKFDISFEFYETNDQLSIGIEYAADLFSVDRMARMARHLQLLCEQVAAGPDIAVEELRLLSEERQLLETFQGPVVDYGADRTLPGMFTRQARWHGSRVAVVYRGREWTYKEVDGLSNQLGNYLQKEYGIGREELVGVVLGRGEWQVISLLAVLKAGGAYVPVDPAWPAERVNYLRQDGGWRVCLDESEIAKFLSVQEQYLPEEPGVTVSGEQLAYVLYTSGSTGRPKGCMLEHRGVVNRLEWMWREYGMTEEEVFLQKTTFTFDVSVWELFLPLCWGGKLVLCEQEDIHSPQRLAELIGRYGVSCIHFVPSMLGVFMSEVFGSDHLVQQLSSLKRVMASGEALGTSLVDRWYQGMPTIPLYNLYGPTEASIDVSHYETGAGMSTVPIGRAVANTRLYVVDGQGRLSPVGVPGELWISGVQVARGYWNREELTAEKFINDPFAEGSRVYRTGDRARWLADGNIEYLGRIDEQVKVRGYRIEPGEIEEVVLQSGLVQQVAVAVWQERLVGYVVGEAFDQVKLVAHLGSRLPEYMVPQLWVELDALPLTASGKIDRKQLPEPSVSGDSYTAPQTATEVELAAIWQEVLNIERVGVSDNFFALGGHSLQAIRILGRINRQWKVRIGLPELFGRPTIAGLAENIDQALEIVQPLQSTIAVAPVQDTYPLSSGQERLWILQQLYPGNYSYNVVHSYSYTQVLDPERLQRALDTVVERHEILRTRFVVIEGEPRQRILTLRERPVMIDFRDLRQETNKREVIDLLFATESGYIFDLSAGPLFRVALLRLKDDVFRLVLNLHHIVTDEWSTAILLKEWKDVYDRLTEDGVEGLPPLRIQYKDYAVWQRGQLSAPSMEASRRYWVEQFAGQEPVGELPADRRRPLAAEFAGEAMGYWFPEALSQGLRELAGRQEASIHMTVLSLIRVLLYRYTGQSRVSTGMSLVGREHADLEGQIGFYVNTLPVVGEVRGEEPFVSLLARTKGQVLRCYEHQGYPFERLVSELNLSRENNRNPLFDVMVDYYHWEGRGPGAKRGGGVFSFPEEEGVASKFDCTFAILDREEELRLELTYKRSLFEEGRMWRMLGHLERLAEQVVADPGIAVGSLRLVSGPEEGQLLEEFQGPVVDVSGQRGVLDLFGEQVSRQPEGIALVCKGREWTYEEVEGLSNQLGNYLQKQYGIGREVLVGVLLERSEWLVIGLLAVLKTGAAYVPVDPSYPAERVGYLRQDGGWGVCLDEAELERFLSVQEQYSSAGVEVSVSADQLAYVIYTSGSTGRPKGCAITHGSLGNYVGWANGFYFGEGKAANFGLYTSIAFDLTLTAIFCALTTGGRLTVYGPELDSESLLRESFAAGSGVDSIKITPSHISMLGRLDLSATKIGCAIVGGEALTETQVSILKKLNGGMRIYNEYGPTETTVGCIVKEIAEGEPVVIGRPIGNTRVYVVDGQGGLLPVGVAGELWIGGAGVARGYWNKEELTAEKFVADPFVPGGRVYKTGDRARWLPDGNMEYLGRIDEQVKVRGYRIEPGEIEGVVLESGMVEQVVVVVREERLVGYVVGEEFDQAKLVGYLGSRLPEYLVPQLWVELEKLPVTGNGKLDKQGLPEPLVRGGSYRAPGTATEVELAGIWQEMLEVERVGVDDDFFGLGGHSLLGIRILVEVERRMGVRLGLGDLFNHPTVGQLSGCMDRELSGSRVEVAEAIPVAAEREYYPVSSGQWRMWVQQELYPGNYSYNIVYSYTYGGMLEADRLQRSLDRLVERHEILRTRFIEIEGEPRQRVLSPVAGAISIDHRDLRSEPEAMSIVDLLIGQESRHVFDLASTPLMRIHTTQLTDRRYLLIVNLHHIITDERSMEVLLQEWRELYEGTVEREPLRIQYKDYAVWQQSQLADPSMETSRRFWMEQFAGQEPVAELPADRRRPVTADFTGETIGYWFAEGLQRRLRELAADRGASMYMLLLSLIEVLMYNYTGESRVVTGTPTLGRDHADLERQIGFYINTLAIAGEVKGEETFLSLLARTKGQVLRCYEHQGYPFDRLVSELNIARDVNRNPLFDVMVAYHHDKAKEKEQTAGVFVFTGEDGTTSKFDCSLSFIDTEKGLQLQLNYKPGLYDRSRMERMICHLERLAEQVVADPGIAVQSLILLSEAEERRLLEEFQGPAMDYPRDRTWIELFEEQALLSPTAIAVEHGSETITYQELDERSNQLGHYLRGRGVGRDTVVGVCMDRGVELLIALLGIQKAGGGYLPIDPAYPVERMGYMLKDTGCGLVLADGVYGGKVTAADDEGVEELEWVDISGGGEWLPEYGGGALKVQRGHRDLAYVIYTSGSTGVPKGVAVEQGALLNFLWWMKGALGVDETSGLMAVTTYVFDISYMELYLVLLAGGRVIVADREIAQDGYRLRELLAVSKVSHMQATPSTWQMLWECGWRNEDGIKIMTGGEAIGEVLKDRLVEISAEGGVWNMYGPTETTIWSSVGELRQGEQANIGKPIGNTRMYVLDTQQRSLPVGVAGELYIGGAGLARGYWNQEQLTAEKFVADPYVTGGRMYRTGDRARWLSDGRLEYMGRLDEQMKVRGYRIEPGEIEGTVMRSGWVEQVVVRVWQERLVGYVVAGGFNQAKLVEYLSSRLPEYMVPHVWMRLEALPLTGNGKVDRKRLPSPELSLAEDGYVAPRTAIGKMVAAIWQTVLGIEKIGINDNFFRLGGHSLVIIQILGKARKYSLPLKLTDFFYYQTIGEQAEVIRSRNYDIPAEIAGESHNHLVLLHEGGEGPAVYIIPGIEGACDGYYELAESIGGNGFPVYGIQMLGLGDDEEPIDNIEDIARRNILWIRERQPKGPYRFIGHSFGSMVLYDMIKQLEQANEVVELAIMLDTTADSTAEKIKEADLSSMIIDDMKQYFEFNQLMNASNEDWLKEMEVELSGLAGREMVAYVEREMQQRFPGQRLMMSIMRYIRLLACNYQISYLPETILSTGLLIVKAEDTQRSTNDTTLGWSEYAEKIAVMSIPGTHSDMIRHANAKLLVRPILDRLV